MGDARIAVGKLTIKQVAERAKVGVATVSRVLNDSAPVGDAVRTRVLSAVSELGYESDLLASALRRGSTHTIGFIVSDIANPLFAHIATAAEEIFQRAGYALLLWNSHGDPERDTTGVRLLTRRRVDGLILSVSDETRVDTIETLAQVNPALVLIDRELSGMRASAVLSDHEHGMRVAVEHLLRLGHERIALATGPLNLRPSRLRAQAFKKTMEAAGIQVDEDLMHLGSFSVGFGEQAIHRLFALESPPTAVIVGGNLLMEGVLRALQARGLKVGNNVSLISCDDVPIAALHSPPVTVIARDTAELGRHAAAIMLRLLRNGPAEPIVETLPTQLIVRESTLQL